MHKSLLQWSWTSLLLLPLGAGAPQGCCDYACVSTRRLSLAGWRSIGYNCSYGAIEGVGQFASVTGSLVAWTKAPGRSCNS